MKSPKLDYRRHHDPLSYWYHTIPVRAGQGFSRSLDLLQPHSDYVEQQDFSADFRQQCRASDFLPLQMVLGGP